MMLVNKAVAHTWYCDVLGHMTTRFYLHMFDDASYHLYHQAFGWVGAQDDEGRLGLVDVRHVIEYRAEVHAGDALEIHGCIQKIGNKSITCWYEMTNLRTGETAATWEVIAVLFDLKERQAVPLTDEVRAAAETHLAPAAGN